MDQTDNNPSTTFDFQQNVYLEMMKNHISDGLPFQYPSTNREIDDRSNVCSAFSFTKDLDQVPHQYHPESIAPNDDDDVPMPVSYKKRARIKFSQEQLDTLEATFEQHRYPTIDIVDDLVEQLNLPTQKITVWFQNRRARLKKSQQKGDEHPSLDRDEQQHYDSGIHLDEEVSRASSTSPPASIFCHIPTPPPPVPYYPPNPHSTFYNPMWQNFRYPFHPTMPYASSLPYDFVNHNSPFVLQDMTNYQHPTDFHG